MEQLKIDVHSQEYMEAMAVLMSEALESPEGLQALAAAISPPIEQEIKRKEISSLLLTRHVLPKGERPVYQKKPQVKAYWISKEGEAREQEVGQDEVEFPTNRIHTAPMVDVGVLKHGNIGTLLEIQTSAADEIRKEIDKRTISVISQAVPTENTVAVSGGKLTDDALNEAVSILEDKELSVKYIVLRGVRVASSLEKINSLAESWRAEKITRGWSRQGMSDTEQRLPPSPIFPTPYGGYFPILKKSAGEGPG